MTRLLINRKLEFGWTCLVNIRSLTEQLIIMILDNRSLIVAAIYVKYFIVYKFFIRYLLFIISNVIYFRIDKTFVKSYF